MLAGMECVNRKLAAKELLMTDSAFSELMAKSRAGKAKPSLKFFQRKKGCDAWFPLAWIREYVEEVGTHNVK